METNVRIFKGPNLGFTTILLIAMNLVFLFGMRAGNFLIYGAGLGLVNLTYYLLYRNGMNYFLLTENSIVVKNKWRLGFEREIPYKKIKSANTYQMLSNGPTLELVLTDDRVQSFSCSNIGAKKVETLVAELTGKISPSQSSIDQH
jgi:hypothetical protein